MVIKLEELFFLREKREKLEELKTQ